MSERRLLYFCPIDFGGLAEYGHRQANALAKQGIEVVFLAPPGFEARSDRLYNLSHLPTEYPKVRNRIKFVRFLLQAHRFLAKQIENQKIGEVLFPAYSETLAPIWAPRFRRFRSRGVRFGAVVHDPKRVRFFGPEWWSQKSIRDAYSVFDELFTHAPYELGYDAPAPTVIPHGPYPAVAPTETREATRTRLGIGSGELALLAFGHIRDYKNIHLAIEALAEIEGAILIVAGSEPRKGERTLEDYRSLAEQFGVADRCRWCIGYAQDEEVANLFQVGDIAMLAYSGSFHSASGVLNLAISYRKPVIASAGDSNLRCVMEAHRLGMQIEPDSVSAISDAVEKLRVSLDDEFDWVAYECENSWARNAELVAQKLFVE